MQLFASWVRCNFFIYISSDVDENCELFDDDAQEYLGTCPVYGQPFYGEEGEALMQVG